MFDALSKNAKSCAKIVSSMVKELPSFLIHVRRNRSVGAMVLLALLARLFIYPPLQEDR
jgi:hypothetical protein